MERDTEMEGLRDNEEDIWGRGRERVREGKEIERVSRSG